MSMIQRVYEHVFHQPQAKVVDEHTFKLVLAANDAALAHRNMVCGTVTCIFDNLTKSLRDKSHK